ncbi:hypothetical protein K2X14_14585 [Acetobacter sp. TBRC 12305]|uniref:Uncharacterized protein n=1 Tax=Acetobacter garciniae TaxID=2817435 RepID=A0A939KNY7_9PROT|nr:hypothetical protein [Acetobacter garciniae]MBO1326200.1 hypothetical protein [Acetobacter garciniae]MBX0346063.1 hypothetical protein [Acetobacter garciniae]
MAHLILQACLATRMHTRDGSYTITELMSDWYPGQEIIATRLDQIAGEVAQYGARVAAERPHQSFAIVITVPRGQRRPAGFDAAYRSGKLGTDTWLREIIRKPEPCADDYGVASWGTKTTPFQFDGCAPLWPEVTPDPFTDPADGCMGLHGWLRATDARVRKLRPAVASVLEVASLEALRAAYAERRHPMITAQDALRASPQEIAA